MLIPRKHCILWKGCYRICVYARRSELYIIPFSTRRADLVASAASPQRQVEEREREVEWGGAHERCVCIWGSKVSIQYTPPCSHLYPARVKCQPGTQPSHALFVHWLITKIIPKRVKNSIILWRRKTKTTTTHFGDSSTIVELFLRKKGIIIYICVDLPVKNANQALANSHIRHFDHSIHKRNPQSQRHWTKRSLIRACVSDEWTVQRGQSTRVRIYTIGVDDRHRAELLS